MSDAPTFVRDAPMPPIFTRDAPTFTRDAPAGTIASAFDRISAAAREGYGSETLPSILTPAAQSALETSPGIVNREINAPLARLAGTALAGMSGLFRGGQQAVLEATGSRDLAALPEAFMGSPGMLRGPRLPEPALPDISGVRLAPRPESIGAPAPPTETGTAAPAGSNALATLSRAAEQAPSQNALAALSRPAEAEAADATPVGRNAVVPPPEMPALAAPDAAPAPPAPAESPVVAKPEAASAPSVESAPAAPPEPDIRAPAPAPKPARAPSVVTPYDRAPKEPTRLIDFLRTAVTVHKGHPTMEHTIPGGIKDVGGDIEAIIGGARGRPGLINNKAGRHLDNAVIHAFEAGYFPEHTFDNLPDINDLKDAIREDASGNPQYSIHDQDALDAYHDAIGRNTEIDRLASEHGIPTEGITQPQFFDALHDKLGMDDFAARQKEIDDAFDAEHQRFEQAGKAWIAYHGTPHEFDQFDVSKIGTGEGAQAYGHGLYFAENEGIAHSYQTQLAQDTARDAINTMMSAFVGHALGGKVSFNDMQIRIKAALNASDANVRPLAQNDALIRDMATIAFGTAGDGTVSDSAVAAYRRLDKLLPEGQKGNLYTVRLKASPDEMLDWDKPLSEQPPKVRDAVLDLLKKTGHEVLPGDLESGSAAYHMLGERDLTRPRQGEDTSPFASKALRAAGIKGIRYLDAGSRTGDKATHNVVIFDHGDVEITHKNGRPVKAGWNPAEFSGKDAIPTLEDLENEWRQAEAADAVVQRPEGGGGPEPSGAHPGNGPQREGQGGGDPAHAGRSGPSESKDILGRDVPIAVAPRAPTPTFTRDPNQIAMPGAEPSAVQAQAARDAGRGTLHTDAAQKPADEGLFDTNARKQRPLFTRD